MATAREEAERLVAAALAAASFASRASRRPASARDAHHDDGPGLDDLAGLANLAVRFLGGRPAEPPPASSGHHIATGSAECCICPICRAIAAIRDPSPEFAERLASGASDLAAGLTSILRAFGEAARRGETHPVVEVRPHHEPVDHAPGPVEVDEAEAEDETDESARDSAWPRWPDFGSVWQAATRVQDDRKPAPDATDADTPEPARPPAPKKAMAKKVAKKAVKKAVPMAGDEPVTQSAPVSKAAPAKKATPAKKSVAKETPPKKAPKKAAAKSETPKKSPAKKAVAKKAVAGSETAGAEAGVAQRGSAKKAAAKKSSGPRKA